MREKFEQMLMRAVDGIELTESEIRILKWLAGWDGFAVDNVCSIIKKCREARNET
ncbi:MAG: hypothetical protein K0R34_4092 [Herbinix sp.]|nr:hypothetical protein [Herbinix sp.]